MTVSIEKLHHLPDFPKGHLLGEKVTEKAGRLWYDFINRKGILLTTKTMEVTIMKYICDVCGWEYDEEAGYPEGGIAPGTKWEDLPEDFQCPLCLVGKEDFSEN